MTGHHGSTSAGAGGNNKRALEVGVRKKEKEEDIDHATRLQLLYRL